MNALEKRLETAIPLAIEAGRLALHHRPPPGAPAAILKDTQDWLTEADGAVEAFLSDRLKSLFPEDGFQGEETGNGRTGTLRWVVDPIDGTSNYARGGNRFCVSLGLLDAGEALLGVIHAPALSETFAARKAAGATLNNAKIHAATTTDLSRAMVECGWSHRRPNAHYFQLVERVMTTGASLRAGGSGALGLAEVAAGRIDAYLELHINLWDVAAALAILREAGAVSSAFLSGEGQTKGNPIFAAAPGVAEKLLSATAFPTNE